MNEIIRELNTYTLLNMGADPFILNDCPKEEVDGLIDTLETSLIREITTCNDEFPILCARLDLRPNQTRKVYSFISDGVECVLCNDYQI